MLQLAKNIFLSPKTNLRCVVRCRHGIRRHVIGSFNSEEEYLKSLEKKKESRKPKQENRKPDKLKPEETIDEEFDYYSDLPREILDLKFQKPNPAKLGAFSSMMMNMKSRSYRDRQGSCLLEGRFLITDAMKSRMFIRSLYFSRLENLVDLPLDILRKTNLVKVPLEEIKMASEVKVQTEGLLAIATKQDDVTRKKVIEERKEMFYESGDAILPVTLVCDNIRDAGNMGTLLRSAAAVGCEQVLVTKGCTDIWDPKTIRAGAGAHFKIPIVPNLTWEDIAEQMKRFDVADVFLSHHSMEDLNLGDLIPDLEDSPNSVLYQKLTSELGVEQDSDLSGKNFSKIVFESVPYYDLNFQNRGHRVIVLGGEVTGVSPDACLYSLETLGGKPGQLVNIPMTTGSDCLNTAVAGSVLLFEAKRQLLKMP